MPLLMTQLLKFKLFYLNGINIWFFFHEKEWF